MILETNFKKFLIVTLASIALTACATQGKKGSQLAGDVYTGTETVEYLATGVKDRVFFATNKSTLTTASRDTLRKQAAWMRKKSKLKFTIEVASQIFLKNDPTLIIKMTTMGLIHQFLSLFSFHYTLLNQWTKV